MATTPPVVKTTTQLADGRELIYFDDEPGHVHRAVDRRAIEPVTLVGERRFDPLLGEWVLIAAHRQGRTHLPAREQCPLCPSTEGNLTEIPDGTYDVVVFENRFPSLAMDAELPPAVDTGPLVPRAPGSGRCEVVVYSPAHDAALVDLPPRRVRTIVEAWVDRTVALRALAPVEYVFVFENRGPEIGVTLHHPHGQIYAYPFVPPVVERMAASAAEHRRQHGSNLFADLLAAERAAATRVVTTTEHWTAFVPAAARWPVELHVYPNRPAAALDDLTDDERDDFSTLYPELLRRLDAVYDRPLPFIAAWYQAPPAALDWWLHLRVASIRRAPDKIKYLAGSESAMGVFINDVAPEAMAARLRDLAG